jgi:hypothetical protein
VESNRRKNGDCCSVLVVEYVDEDIRGGYRDMIRSNLEIAAVCVEIRFGQLCLS